MSSPGNRSDSQYAVSIYTNYFVITYADTNFKQQYFTLNELKVRIVDANFFLIGDNLEKLEMLNFNNDSGSAAANINDYVEEILLLAIPTTTTSGTSSDNIDTFVSNTIDLGNGASGVGTLRVSVSTDSAISTETINIGTTTAANNVLLTSTDTEIGNIGTTTSANNVLSATTNTLLTNIGTTTTANNVLLASTDTEITNIGTTTTANNSTLGMIDTKLGNLNTKSTTANTHLADIEETNKSTVFNAVLGNDPNAYTMALRGFADGFDVADGEISVWDDNTKLVFLTSVETMDIVSTSALDTSAGTGARTLVLLGLDASYEPIFEIITMNGLTPVVSTLSYLRITNVVVNSCGSLQENQGDIQITATTTGSMQAHMNQFESVASLSYTTVPAGYQGFLTKLHVQLEGQTGGSNPIGVCRLVFYRNESVGAPCITGFKFVIDSNINTNFVLNTDMGGPIAATNDVSLFVSTDVNAARATSAVFIYFKAIP